MFQTELLCKFGFVFDINLAVTDVRLVEQGSGDTAVGAGFGGEEKCFANVGVAIANFFILFGFYVNFVLVDNVVLYTVFVFLCLTVVPVLNGTVVTCDTGVNFGIFAAAI